jgi:hypothetical protein
VVALQIDPTDSEYKFCSASCSNTEGNRTIYENAMFLTKSVEGRIPK